MLDVPKEWTNKTDEPHPEETSPVLVDCWFEHPMGAQVIVWIDRKYSVELRTESGRILTKNSFDSVDDAHKCATRQMQQYPMQEVTEPE